MKTLCLHTHTHKIDEGRRDCMSLLGGKDAMNLLSDGRQRGFGLGGKVYSFKNGNGFLWLLQINAVSHMGLNF